MMYAVGDALAPFVIESVSSEAMKQWAGFLHDPNPIHLDPAAVKAKGMGDTVINQGPANAAYLVNMLMAAFPKGRILSLDSQFVDNVYAGERVTANGTITAIDDETATCSLSLDVEGRGTAIVGSAVVRLQPTDKPDPESTPERIS